MARHDVVVIGAGHNGLVTACYLARAGLKVLVLERNDYVGGAAVSRELYPGFKYSNCSYVCSLLRPEIVRERDLPRFGLQVIPYEGAATLTRGGDYLASYADHDNNRREIARHSRRDAEAYDEFSRDLMRQCRFIKPLLMRTPHLGHVVTERKAQHRHRHAGVAVPGHRGRAVGGDLPQEGTRVGAGDVPLPHRGPALLRAPTPARDAGRPASSAR